jgi:membrane protease YdiL (CAAX protease family)
MGVHMLKRLFVMQDGRLRPEWRIIVALVFTSIIAGLLFLVFWGTITAAVEVPTDLTGEQTEEFLVKGMEEVVDGSGWLKLIQRLIPSVALILGILLALRLLDKKKPADIGAGSLSGHRREFACGLALGAVSMAVVFAALLASGSITLENSLADPRFSWNLLAGAVLFIFVGFTEELYSRAYSISALSETWNRWAAAVVTSLIFSLLHVGNDNVSLTGLVNVGLVGFLFAYMFLRTGNLWMPAGYHITWNYFQGYIFGFPVSGRKLEGVYTVAASHNDLLTGGAFGPEGGILTTLVILAGLYTVWRFTGGGNPWGIKEPELQEESELI